MKGLRTILAGMMLVGIQCAAFALDKVTLRLDWVYGSEQRRSSWL